MRDNGDLPWDMLPILQTPEGTIAESSSILRFVGHLSGFIPEKPFQIAKADEFIDAMGPLSKALDSNFSVNSIAGMELKSSDMNSDIHASAEYRANLVVIQAKKAVEAC